MAQENAKAAFVNKDNVAVSGYDVVAYFTQNKAVRGQQSHELTHAGVKYWFSSDAHKQAFAKEPQKYLPAFGGWCAFAMAMNNGPVPSNPATFKLYNGKLYLFYNDFYQGAPFNTIVPWNANEAELKKKADKHWNGMKR